MARCRLAVTAALALLAAVDARSALAVDQTLLGLRVRVRDPNLSDPTRRVVNFRTREPASTNTLEGDPTVDGGTLEISIDGTTPSTQSFFLASGGFRPTVNGFRYVDSVGPVRLFILRRTPPLTPQGVFRMQANIQADFAPVVLVPPNTLGPQGVSITFTTGGDRYCTAYGGAAGGQVTKDDAQTLRVIFPTAEAPCPGSPSGAFLEEDAG